MPQDEYNRLANLRQQKFVSVEALNQAQTTLQAAEATLAAAKSAVSSAQASLQKAQAQRAGAAGQTENTSIAEHPKVQAAAAQFRQAYLTLERTRILAPATGDIAQRAVQVGARVIPGTPLMVVIPPEQMWVDANFKETQLDNVRLGQSVKLTADVYGSDVVYHGKVAGFAAGTGSAFALLPAQNPSGNWIKIVQRVPVRIELDPAELQQHPLRIGLSVRVEVDTHDRSGAIVVTSSGKDKTTLSSTNVFTLQSTAADAEIARIIAANTSKAAREPSPSHSGEFAASDEYRHAGVDHAGVGAGFVHEHSRLVDCECVRAVHFRRFGGRLYAGDVGDYFLRGVGGHYAADDRLAGATFRASAHVRDGNLAIYAGIVVVWDGSVV